MASNHWFSAPMLTNGNGSVDIDNGGSNGAVDGSMMAQTHGLAQEQALSQSSAQLQNHRQHQLNHSQLQHGQSLGPSSSTSSTQPTHQDLLDRQMIRHLLSRYSQEDITRLLQEESSSSSSLHNDAASVFTSSTYSSVKSDDTHSLFDGAPSIRAASDTSSNRGSIISNVTSRTAKFLNRKSHSSLPSGIDDISLDGQTDDSYTTAGHSSAAAKHKGSFSCGFCKEEGIQKTCTRKNDLKRHIEDFHNMNAQWFCRHRECTMVFDWQTAYKTHLKHAHGGSRVSLDDAKVHLCPQTVFACGFDNCAQVYEAPSDSDAPVTFKEYVAHVVKHFDEGSNSREWSYSTRMRNLLKQNAVVSAWIGSDWDSSKKEQMTWQSQSSRILRKRLETKHIGDVQLLVMYALALGSDPANVTSFRDDFITPIRDQCQYSFPGHKPEPTPPVPKGQSGARDDDQFKFKISRAHNQGLATYLASQRSLYVQPRSNIRQGHSSRGQNTHNGVVMSSGSAGRFRPSPISSQYGFQQRQMYNSGPHPPQQQQGMMMQQVNNGLLGDDMNAFGTAITESPESDIDMKDPQLINPSFADHQQHQQQVTQGFPAEYGTNGLVTTTAEADMMHASIPMDQTSFVSYGGPQAY